MQPAFPVLMGADLPSVFGDAADIPAVIPQLPVTDLLHGMAHIGIVLHIVLSPQPGSRLQEVVDGPVMKEGYECALSASQIQAVVPVGTKPLADAVSPDLLRGKIQDFLHMLIDRAASAVGIGDDLIKESVLSGLLYIFHNGGDQPERIVRAGILKAVNHIRNLRSRHNRRRFKRLHLRVRIEPLRLE